MIDEDGIKIGENIQIGDMYFQITSKDLLIYKKEVTLATVTATTQKFDDDLQPNREFLYQILRVAVDGYLTFQLQFPEGVPHWSPHGITQRLDNILASYPAGIKAPMWIMNPYYPAFNVYNPKGYAVTGTFWFFGWKYTVKQLTERPAVVTTVTDYARGGGGG